MKVEMRATSICLLICVSSFAQAVSFESLNENEWNADKIENYRNRLHNMKKCNKNGDLCVVEKLNEMQSKRNNFNKLYNLTPNILDEEIPLFYSILHNENKSGCSCKSRKHLLDLGANYFPRYVSDMTCIPGNCGDMKCQPQNYKLWVMRKREESDTQPGSVPVPKELRDNWIGESISTTVDCTCMPQN